MSFLTNVRRKCPSFLFRCLAFIAVMSLVAQLRSNIPLSLPGVQPGAQDTSKPENLNVAQRCAALLLALKGITVLHAVTQPLTSGLAALTGAVGASTTAPLNNALPGIQVKYICTDAREGGAETIALQYNVVYAAKPGAQGSHPLCADARKALRVPAAPCGVANHPNQITTDPSQRYPEDALVKAHCLTSLATIQNIVADLAMLVVMELMETTYSCAEITNTATEKESLKHGLTVHYTCKPGGPTPHQGCEAARKALGVTGTCGSHA